MLSKILSRIFLWLGAIVMVFGSITLIVQLRQQPIMMGNTTIGQPGMQVAATRNLSNETAAPDTSLGFVIRRADGSVVDSNLVSIANTHGQYGNFAIAALAKGISAEKQKGNSVRLDTLFTMIEQMEWPTLSSAISSSSSSYDALPDGRIAYVETKTSEDNKKLPTYGDTFPNRQAYNIFDVTGTKKNFYSISSGSVKETLWLMPSGTAQRIFFLVNYVFDFAYALLLFYFLYQLFKNFSKRDYLASGT